MPIWTGTAAGPTAAPAPPPPAPMAPPAPMGSPVVGSSAPMQNTALRQRRVVTTEYGGRITQESTDGELWRDVGASPDDARLVEAALEAEVTRRLAIELARFAEAGEQIEATAATTPPPPPVTTPAPPAARRLGPLVNDCPTAAPPPEPPKESDRFQLLELD